MVFNDLLIFFYMFSKINLTLNKIISIEAIEISLMFIKSRNDSLN